jgi:stage III sporulation protein AE
VLQPFQEAIVVVVTVLLYATIQSILETFTPRFQTIRFIMFFLVIITVADYVIEAFIYMKQLTEIFTTFFIAFLPLVTMILALLQSVLLFISWTPVVLFIVQALIYFCDKLLLPLLIISVVLDVSTRLYPELSFHRLAQLIRKSIFSFVAAAVVGLSSVLTVSGLSWFTVRESIVSPVKKMIEQNIPIIGSLLVEGVSLMKGFQVTATTLTGWAIVTTMLVLCFTPVCLLLIKAFTLLFLGAITEPLLEKQTSQLLDDLGNAVLLLCAVSLLLAIGFTLTWLVIFLLFQIGTGKVL